MTRLVLVTTLVAASSGCADAEPAAWTLDRATSVPASRPAADELELRVEVVSTRVVEASASGEPGLHTRLVLRPLHPGAVPRQLVAEVPGGVLGDRARFRSDHPVPRPGDRVRVTLRRAGSIYRLAPGSAAVRPVSPVPSTGQR